MTHWVSAGARGFALCLAMLMLLAAAHKAVALRRGHAANDPLLKLNSWRRTHAPLLFAGVATMEVGLAVGLVFDPPVGLALTIGLLTLYSREMRRLQPEDSCNCFGETLHSTSRRSALVRNGVLGGLGALVLSGYAVGVIEIVSLSQAIVGGAFVVMATAVGVDSARRVAGSSETFTPHLGEGEAVAPQ